jgi:hypothetical protein
MIPGSANPLLLATAAGAAGGYEIERSLRFNSADSAYLNRTPGSAGNRKTWTGRGGRSGWVTTNPELSVYLETLLRGITLYLHITRPRLPPQTESKSTLMVSSKH